MSEPVNKCILCKLESCDCKQKIQELKDYALAFNVKLLLEGYHTLKYPETDKKILEKKDKNPGGSGS
jgi:hypothetical protein